MGESFLAQLWDGMRRLVAQLQGGRYWTERRDACQELARVARQAIWRVRQAARDRDPDVAHWGAQACAELAQLLSGSHEELALKLDEELARGGLEPDQPPATLTATAGAASSDAIAPTALGTPEGLTAWLQDFTAQQGGVFTIRPNGASMTLNLSGGRRQTFYLDLGYKDSEGEPIALFYSICGEASPEHYLWALQANSNLSGGAFSIIQRQGRNMMIMVMRWRLAELSDAWLRQRLFYLARKADWAEANIHEQDEH